MESQWPSDTAPERRLCWTLFHAREKTRKKSYSVSTVIAAHIGSGQIMGWGEKAIEVRSVETGLLDGVFMHKRAQTFRFLCERNEKVSLLLSSCHLSRNMVTLFV